ncbi:nucleotide pyrophosphohydrolase (plasmid) [Bacillus mycoides]|uniref:nucleotide pyrophosphohydrolase n=1 Tax=Bacillus mycoides TaxID=1405 RepID=UPI001C0167AB|nr:nucleotide pyrophosphohydrolase [Bacillus mycoides]QWH15289.1 nucleotide pyrophosphohydrolase [Bacillus mycoides]
MKDKSLEDLISIVVKFRDDRNWKQFHNAKDLAISISLEASELLENFQWKTSEEAVCKDLNNIKDELADIYIYGLLLADELGIDIEKAIKEKIEKNSKKYPVQKAYGSNKKYTELK